MSQRDASLEQALAALARLREMLGNDPEGLAKIRELTGLTITDPVADEETMAKRLLVHRPLRDVDLVFSRN